VQVSRANFSAGRECLLHKDFSASHRWSQKAKWCSIEHVFEDNQRVDPAAELPELAAAIASLAAPTPGGPARAAGTRVRALLMLKRQLEHQLLAEVASFDRQGFADSYGSPSTASWLRCVGYLDHGQATRVVSAARTAALLPLVDDELAAGRIGVEHIEAVARETRAVPDEEVAQHDKTLRDLTIWARPADMASAGRKITEVYQHDLAEDEPERLREVRRFNVAQTFDGLWHVEGLLPADVGAQLVAVTDPLARKRGPEDDRTPTQRRADALAELVDTVLRVAPLPDAGGERPRLTLVVRAREDEQPSDLVGRRGLHQALIASGGLMAAFAEGSDANLVGCQGGLAPETLARLACEADINVAHVGPAGDVLSLGRSSRFPSLAQRRALVIRDGGCVFPGCDRRPSACQAHHLRFWSDGGPTDLDNLALLCHYHHHVVHEDHWVLERMPPGPATPVAGWRATSPDGLVLHEFRQPAA
jgi:hypothetical protein